jgi:endonuclease/exonuclease/phosphatase family metal-dependent hydrolase
VSTLRIATLNTWKGESAYRRRLELMAEGLSAIAPDVVLLQEVVATPDGGINTARHLAVALGMAMRLLPARRKTRSIEGRFHLCDSGLAILSRFPLRDAPPLALPDDRLDGERWCQIAVSTRPDGELWLANTHLTHLPDRDDLRREQLERIVTRLEALPDSGIAVLGGDLNATPADRSLSWLSTQPILPLVNAWDEHGTRCESTLAPPATPACIDHLWRSARHGSGANWSHAGTAVSQAGDDGTWPSDHVAVYADLRLE